MYGDLDGCYLSSAKDGLVARWITSATMKEEIEKSPHAHVYSTHRESRVSRVVVQFLSQLNKTHQNAIHEKFI